MLRTVPRRAAMTNRSGREGRPWHLFILALATIGVAIFAVTQIGPPTSSARTSSETVTAENGVVQTTVSGTGNVEAGVDDDVNFQTSGTLESVDVKVGQHVTEGQLLGTLDTTSDQLAVDQAQENLTAAEDQLTALEDGTSTGSGSSGSSGAAASYTGGPSPEFVDTTAGSGSAVGAAGATRT